LNRSPNKTIRSRERRTVQREEYEELRESPCQFSDGRAPDRFISAGDDRFVINVRRFSAFQTMEALVILDETQTGMTASASRAPESPAG